MSAIVSISVGPSSEQAVSAAWANTLTTSEARAPKLTVSISAPAVGGRVEERLHAVVVAGERVGGERHAVGDVAGAPHDGGVEAVGADHLDVAEPGGLELLEQHAGARHDHRRVEHVGRRVERGQLVHLRREVLVGDAEREVPDDLAARLGEGLGERRRRVREVRVVGRRERHGRRRPPLGGELGGGRGLHRVAEAHQERAAAGSASARSVEALEMIGTWPSTVSMSGTPL